MSEAKTLIELIDEGKLVLIGKPYLGFPERCERKNREEFVRLLDAGRRFRAEDMNKQKVKCQCGCGRDAYANQLTEVVVDVATDQTLRQAKTKQRFRVLRQCKAPFEEELGMMTCLQLIVSKWAPRPKTLAQKLNVLATLDQWWLRVGAALKVMRLQHAIYERTKGFNFARKRALQSAVLFGCPRFLQGWLMRRLMAAAKRQVTP